MENRNGRMKRVVTFISVAVVMLSIVLVGAACGTGTKSDSSDSSSSKLPPGTTKTSLSSTSTTETTAAGTVSDSTDSDSNSSSTSTTGTSATSSSSPMVTLDLAGARFTIVSAERKTSNKDVVSGEGREINGDYMEIELKVENVGTDLLDLSDFSFRFNSPGIDADAYSDYYGDTGIYGKYVSENTISGSLLDYSSLSEVGYLMKIGENVEKVFLFFDLNPDSTQLNTGVTKDNSMLVIKKISGSDYGDYIDMGLIGYPDE